MKVKSETIARTICLVLALVNQCLAVSGKGKIEFVENDVYQFVSLIFTFVTAVTAWWKNNSFTQAALKGDEVMNRLKAENYDND